MRYWHRPTLLIGLVSFHGDSPPSLFAQPSTATLCWARALLVSSETRGPNGNSQLIRTSEFQWKQHEPPLDRDDDWELAAIQSSKSLQLRRSSHHTRPGVCGTGIDCHELAIPNVWLSACFHWALKLALLAFQQGRPGEKKNEIFKEIGAVRMRLISDLSRPGSVATWDTAGPS